MSVPAVGGMPGVIKGSAATWALGAVDRVRQVIGCMACWLDDAGLAELQVRVIGCGHDSRTHDIMTREDA